MQGTPCDVMVAGIVEHVPKVRTVSGEVSLLKLRPVHFPRVFENSSVVATPLKTSNFSPCDQSGLLYHN